LGSFIPGYGGRRGKEEGIIAPFIRLRRTQGRGDVQGSREGGERSLSQSSGNSSIGGEGARGRNISMPPAPPLLHGEGGGGWEISRWRSNLG